MCQDKNTLTSAPNVIHWLRNKKTYHNPSPIHHFLINVEVVSEVEQLTSREYGTFFSLNIETHADSTYDGHNHMGIDQVWLHEWVSV